MCPDETCVCVYSAALDYLRAYHVLLTFRDHHFFLVQYSVCGKHSKKWLLCEWINRQDTELPVVSVLGSHTERTCGIYSFFKMTYWWCLPNQFEVVLRNRETAVWPERYDIPDPCQFWRTVFSNLINFSLDLLFLLIMLNHMKLPDSFSL